MDYKNIQTSEKMNKVVKEQLIFRDDHLSKYAAKRIEELEQLLIHSVVKSFYCQNSDNDYKDTICKEQCTICLWQEKEKQ